MNLQGCYNPGGTSTAGSKQQLHIYLLKRSGRKRKRPHHGVSDAVSAVASVGGDVHARPGQGGDVLLWWQR